MTQPLGPILDGQIASAINVTSHADLAWVVVLIQELRASEQDALQSNHELRVEVERLRAALSSILGPCVTAADGTVLQCATCDLSRTKPEHHPNCAYRIAQEALTL